MLDQEFAKKWAAALRSGKYRQGRQALRRADGTFCCLGVAADLIDPDGWGPPVVEGHGAPLPYDGCDGLLTTRLLDQIGLDDKDQTELALLNDCDAPFEKIAERVEALAGIGAAS